METMFYSKLEERINNGRLRGDRIAITAFNDIQLDIAIDFKLLVEENQLLQDLLDQNNNYSDKIGLFIYSLYHGTNNMSYIEANFKKDGGIWHIHGKHLQMALAIEMDDCYPR